MLGHKLTNYATANDAHAIFANNMHANATLARCVSSPCSLLDGELVQEVLDELHRLMPKQDPRQTLLRDPSYISKVERGTKRLGPHPDTL